MRKLVIRIVSLFLIFSLFIPTTFAATPETVAPTASNYIGMYGGYLTRTSDGYIVTAHITGTHTVGLIGVVRVTVQESANGTSGWSDVKSWIAAYNPSMMQEDSASHVVNLTFDKAKSGYYYRAYIQVWAGEDTMNGDQRSFYTSVYRFP